MICATIIIIIIIILIVSIFFHKASTTPDRRNENDIRRQRESFPNVLIEYQNDPEFKSFEYKNGCLTIIGVKRNFKAMLSDVGVQFYADKYCLYITLHGPGNKDWEIAFAKYDKSEETKVVLQLFHLAGVTYEQQLQNYNKTLKVINFVTKAINTFGK